MDFNISTPYVSETQCNLINETNYCQCNIPYFTKVLPAYLSLKDLEHFSSNYDISWRIPPYDQCQFLFNDAHRMLKSYTVHYKLHYWIDFKIIMKSAFLSHWQPDELWLLQILLWHHSRPTSDISRSRSS